MHSFMRLFAILAILLCQGCASPGLSRQAPPVHEFRFADAGRAIYFVLDKPQQTGHDIDASYPRTLLFVVGGSECTGMRPMLPQYFDGFEGGSGGGRIFLLQKRFIEADSIARAGACSGDFTKADHPQQWIADHAEFMHAQLEMAEANNQRPQRVALLGISEGGEIVPQLAQRFGAVTHAALFANGGLDPADAYRLQAHRHGFAAQAQAVEHACDGRADSSEHLAAGRTCRYWAEMRATRHADNLLTLSIPLFVAMGEADQLVPVESAWFLRDLFATRGKRNLHLMTIAGADHDFRKDGESFLSYIWEAFDEWLKK